LDWHLEDGTGLKVTQKTNYPWDGEVEIAITPAKPSYFTFHLRIPGWADSAQVTVNGRAVAGSKPGEYLPIERRWAPADVIRLGMEMPPQVLEANPRVADDTGRVALQRGPLVYCLEGLDQPNGVDLADVALNVGQKSASQFENEYVKDLLGGMVVLRHKGLAYERAASSNSLYARYTGQPVKTRQVPLTFIPYYAWANRQATAMQVWTPLSKA
jgi:DUF1680 family protein